MRLVGDLRVFEVASRIPGLHGVELQVVSGAHDLWSRETLRAYKREANRQGIQIPSLSSPFGRGVNLMTAGAEEAIRKSIASCEFLGASVLLVPSFRANCPDLAKPEQFEPVAEMFRRLGPRAAEAGVVLGWENSLSPEDNKRAIDAIAHQSVRVYYDLDNMFHYEHKEHVVSGIRLLGRERICQVHVKNEERLLEETGRVDWRAALAEFKALDYEGWYVFESRHTGEAQLIESTTKNIRFLRERLG
jgi:sugar phosphate isomerase/epimerase